MTVWKVSAQLLAVVGLVYVLSRVAFALAWVLIALVLALALAPLVSWLERHGLRRGLAVLALMVAVIGLLVALGATLVPLVVEQGRELVEAVPGWLDRLRGSEFLAKANEQFGLVDAAKSRLASAATTAAGSAVAFARSILYGVAGTLTVVVMTAFMLLFGPPVMRSIVDAVEPSRRPRLLDLCARMQRAVGGYVAGSIVVAATGGLVTGVALLVLGVPYYLALGLMMVLLGLVPYIGSLIGAVLVVGTTFLSNGLHDGVIALIIFLAYQQVENQLLQPLVQRQTIRMNPLLIALAMLLGTASAGVLGAVLALPTAAAVQILAQDLVARRKSKWQGEPPEAPSAGEAADAEGPRVAQGTLDAST